MGYIYKITNTVNNKYYIGVTTQANPNERWSHHKSAIRADIGCPFLQKAFKKYGEDAFKFEVLIICFDEDVFKFENEYILKYNSMSPNGYNVAVGGQIGMSFLGKKHTEETKKIISEKSKAHNANPEVRERARQNAIKFNKTNNIGELLRKSEKWQKAIAEGRIGGHNQTEEGKKKISEGLKEYYKTQNDQDISKGVKDKKKHSEIMTLSIGRKVSQYSKENILIASFNSIKEGAEKNNLTRKNVQACVSGRSKTAGGFIWRYDTEPKDNIVVIE
jgi:group I intron endonuclease